MTSGLNWVRLGLVGLVVALVAQSIAHAVAVFVFDSYSSVVDLNVNDSAPDVLSTLAIIAAALGAARLAHSQVADRREAWVLAALLTLVVAADIAHTGTESMSVVGALVALALAGVAVLVVRLARASRRQVALLLYGGLGCLVGSLAVSFVFHRVDGYLDVARGDVVYESKIILKQSLELAGWWLVALGSWLAGAGVGTVHSPLDHGRVSDRRPQPVRR
jgi:amino acid transporter